MFPDTKLNEKTTYEHTLPPTLFLSFPLSKKRKKDAWLQINEKRENNIDT